MEETRRGVPIFHGTPQDLPEWKFKVELKIKIVEQINDQGRKAEQMAMLMGDVIDGLRGDALSAAMDLGSVLHRQDGLTSLVTKVERIVIQFKQEEAKALFREGTMTHGLISRQQSESMQQYVIRRRRWYDRLRIMDSETHISENILTDYLLDCSDITETQKLMIKTAVGTGTKWKFDNVALKLKEHHVKIHLNERSKHTTKEPHKGFRSWGNRPAFRRPTRHVAHMATEDDQSVPDDIEDNSEDPDEEEEDDATCYNCVSCGPDEEF